MTAADKRRLRLFVAEISADLGIDPPQVRFSESGLATSTTLAAMAPDGSEIVLRPVARITPDSLFAVSHELRHAWQLRRAPALLEGYLPADQLGTEDYNLQPAEIDANAYAAALMISRFGLRPLFQGLSERVTVEIFRAAQRLADAQSHESNQ